MRNLVYRSFTPFICCTLICAWGVGVCQATAESSVSEQARQIIEATGVEGGFIVHVGCGNGHLTCALKVNDSFQVHGLTRNAAEVGPAREYVRSQNCYGPVAIDLLTGSSLPYVENLVNLLVVEDAESVSREEALRVLVPNGVAYVNQNGQWTKVTKPRPGNIDVWTHFLHDSGGNAVAKDDVVGPPRHLQWLGTPRWSRHHDRMASMSALVSDGGRLFYIMDEGSRISIQLPSKWMLVARDAFNGTILWKRALADWHDQLWPLKSGPAQLARRLVCDRQRVFVTLGLQAPLTAIDSVTGETIRTYTGTKSTEEVVFSQGTLFLLVNEGSLKMSTYLPLHNTGDQARVRQEWFWDENPRRVMAVDADSGEVLWQRDSQVSPMTLAANDSVVVYHDSKNVVCVDRKSGEERWSSPAPRRPDITFNFGPRLAIYGDVVLFAGGERTMRSFSLADGKELWTSPHDRSGYQSPEDLLVSGGLVWSAATTSGKDAGVFTGRDVLTGEVKREFPPTVETYWFHHRCHIAKATEKFLLTSRTGIEFVDHGQQDWTINHWVRGGCHYGIMPCNGMVYVPPHNCACYPEAKQYGFNALASKAGRHPYPEPIAEEQRLEKGPAYGQAIDGPQVGPADWPTFRQNKGRTGSTTAKVSAKLAAAWKNDLGGKLSSVVIGGGALYVAQVDEHRLHCLDEQTGKSRWSYVAGGRIDSPPTIADGRVYFGSVDGWVYCLRASDGQLIWRFQAAPIDRRMMAFEQLESVWPIHGSVLLENDSVYFVAGRSAFLDGGMRLYQLEPETGRQIAMTVIDDVDPETGGTLQDRIQTLNMPVALPDILSSDGKWIYMRSQQFHFDGYRPELGPHSGDPATQGSVQLGETAHLFAPMGFLDETWFHRSYWVHGRSFAGGHSGYSQAGKHAPAGRIIVSDNEKVYGFGRKPEYYRWTTTMEHQLFSADQQQKQAAIASADEQKSTRRGKKKGGGAIGVDFAKTKTISPAGKPVAVEAWVKAEKPSGVIVAHGGPSQGYALTVDGGKGQLLCRIDSQLHKIVTPKRIVGRWVHLVGQLTADKEIQLYLDGKLVASDKVPKLITKEPSQSMQIGFDDGSGVGEYKSSNPLTGLVDEVRVYHATLSGEEVAARAAGEEVSPQTLATAAVICSFDDETAKDASGKGNEGAIYGVTAVDGKVGKALEFSGKGAKPTQQGGVLIEHNWNQSVPLLVRAIVLADRSLFIAGPPDLVDEEESFVLLTEGKPGIEKLLAKQDQALQGAQGGILQVVSADSGEILATYQLESLPSWDGMAAANGRIFLSTTDGKVLCYSGE